MRYQKPAENYGSARSHGRGEVGREDLEQAPGAVITALRHLQASAAFLAELGHGVGDNDSGIQTIFGEYRLGRRYNALHQPGNMLIPVRPTEMHDFYC